MDPFQHSGCVAAAHESCYLYYLPAVYHRRGAGLSFENRTNNRRQAARRPGGLYDVALLWAFFYTLIESFTPVSFLLGGTRLGDTGEFMHLLYFSFTTLTTTGFGDITPVSDQARSLVIIEEFAGVFFVGVLIARLAGLYLCMIPQDLAKAGLNELGKKYG
jgi:hypothetical protein